MKKIIFLLLLFFVNNNIFSKHTDISSLNLITGGYFFDINNVNNTLSSASINNIEAHSIVGGISYSFNSSDSNLCKTLFNKLKYKSYSTIGFFWNYSDISDIVKNPNFNYNILFLERVLSFELSNSIYLNFHFGFNYMWGYLNIANSVNYSDNFKNYLSNPDDIIKFSLDGFNLELSIGFDNLIYSIVNDYPDKIVKGNLYIGTYITLFSPFIYSNGNFKLFESSFRNEINREISGLETKFPMGIMFQLRIKIEGITEFKK
ncbi:MAG: hypothetical protein A2X61_12210 [Ignavibacteria bacterium GWB2_35_12]|nr:MAG: hypothetical protein A2X63_06495 [Ignavibacteria bacterium GWA2_35_8]OGU42530.1 MAG: hypothetical protein A2X61_12210 [Ignavibacteria bacterium GWB2_35_12]OGV19113.1 MAG: hypothetical protein A2475_01005 [Ignavibacteria bacterium RIFOXYC2_FULL_35_21]